MVCEEFKIPQLKATFLKCKYILVHNKIFSCKIITSTVTASKHECSAHLIVLKLIKTIWQSFDQVAKSPTQLLW